MRVSVVTLALALRLPAALSTLKQPADATRALSRTPHSDQTRPGARPTMQQRRRAAAAAGKGGAPAANAAGAGAEVANGQGARLAEELVGEAEEQVERLEKRVRFAKPEAHLGPAPAGEADGEEATIWYFAYGSNINKKVFEGRRMIKPAESVPAVLPGWRLEFSQPGLPYAEPAFAAVERQPEQAGGSAASASAASGGSSSSGSAPARPDVHGVAHRITPSQWRYVLETEGASGQKEDRGYKVVEATAQAYDGRELPGVMTLSIHPNIKSRLQGRDALPSLRYLKLIRDGAADYGLTPEYQAWLAGLRHYQATRPGQKVGKLLFSGIAFAGIFPVWGVVRLLRRATGMQAAGNDIISRAMASYTSLAFAVLIFLHELLRPVLGCGTTLPPPPPAQTQEGG